MTKLAMLTRMGAGLAALAIIVLSVVPGNMRPHLLGNDHYEHFAAYFIALCSCCRAASCSPYAPPHWSSFNCGFQAGPRAPADSRPARLVRGSVSCS
jgi:hypothetical protein